VAVLQNIDNWRQRAEEIAEHAIPITGNKARGLSLARDMHQAMLSLKRLSGLDGD
jgi:hypothetical protein